MVIKWKALVRNNRLVYEDRQRFDSYLIPYEGKVVSVVVKRYTKPRSRAEERFYHGVVKPMVAEEMGIEPETAHKFLCDMFLRVEENNEKYGRYNRTMSTTELNNVEYQEFWKRVQKWASLPNTGELSIESGLELYIPDPNECDYD